jgi:hypothetical protein
MDITSLKDFLGNRESIVTFKKTLGSHSRTNPCRAVLSGPTGCGKTTMARLMMKELGFQVIELDNATLQTLKNMEEGNKQKTDGVLCAYTKANTIESFFDPTPRCIFVDDLDILIVSFPKLLTWVQEWLDAPHGKKYPLVCTINNKEEKKVSDLKQGFQVIKIVRPSVQGCVSLVKALCDSRGIPYDGDSALTLIQLHKADVRSIVENVEQMHPPMDSNKVHVIHSLRSCFSEMTIFQVQDTILSKPLTLNQLEDMLYSDNTLLSLLLYENIGTELKKYRSLSKPVVDIIGDFLRVSSAYVHADIMSEYVNRTMAWEQLPILNSLTLGTINQVANQYPRTSESCADFKFTTLMTKTALRYQYTRKKNEWVDKWGVGDTHFMAMAHSIAKYMATHTPKQSDLSFTKADIDIAAKYGHDFGILDASRITSWRKYGRKLKDKDCACG